jgi:peptide/nickel transport system ATP-binding protein
MLLLEVTTLECSAPAGLFPGWRKGRRSILRSVSFGVEESSTVGLVGPSGSGKSTLAQCIAGLQLPDAGSITLAGTNIFPNVRNRKLIGTSIQLIFQDPGASFDPKMKVMDSMLEAAMLRSRHNHRADITEELGLLLRSVHLTPAVLNRLPRELSGGQLQRLAVARSLLTRPRLLVLDEPTSALDVVNQVALLCLLRSLQLEFGFSILYITHDLIGANAFCDKIEVLSEGTIVEERSPVKDRAR